MKKATPYIILFLVAVAAVLLLMTGNKENQKIFDPRITLRKRDKIPYGAYIAYQNLKHIFPGAEIAYDKMEPGRWDSLSAFKEGQALLIISPRFFAEEYQLKKMLEFAKNGNDVFISAMVMGEDARDFFHCSISYFDFSEVGAGSPVESDSLVVSLQSPPFSRHSRFSYPGHRFDSHFLSVDTLTSTVLGYDHHGNKNFIHLKAGRGNVFVHLAPLAFSNYFLLNRNNLDYYENILSVISPSVKKVIWDEYYINKRYPYPQDDQRKGWFSALLQYPGLKWALLTAMLVLLVYVVLEMRRKQRPIPVMTKPRNDSLDFVKTIGRLYYEKGDHLNLARKMGAYFLEHVRNRYKIPTGNLDEDFVRRLQFKSGYEWEALQELVSFIKHLDNAGAITDKQLASFHKQLETFYQKA